MIKGSLIWLQNLFKILLNSVARKYYKKNFFIIKPHILIQRNLRRNWRQIELNQGTI